MSKQIMVEIARGIRRSDLPDTFGNSGILLSFLLAEDYASIPFPGFSGSVRENIEVLIGFRFDFWFQHERWTAPGSPHHRCEYEYQTQPPNFECSHRLHFFFPSFF